MAHQTGENEQALRKIIDFTRLASIIVLIFHFYFFCHNAMKGWGLTLGIIDRVFISLIKTGMFDGIYVSKGIVFGLLVISLMGVKGKRNDKIQFEGPLLFVLFGTALFFFSHLVFKLALKQDHTSIIYISSTSIGYILILTGGTWISRIIKLKLPKDIFNKLNESFPQEERLLENEYSVNLPAKYILKERERRSWINIINPFRSLLVIGTPGAGKSYFVIRHVITQHIQKGFSMFIYDFKYDDLSRIAFNALLKYQDRYKAKPAFYVINFCERLEGETPSCLLSTFFSHSDTNMSSL